MNLDHEQFQTDFAVRPILPNESDSFNEVLRTSHWLDSGLVGEAMRYVVIENEKRWPLAGFGSSGVLVKLLQ